ncbi:MAG: hypothetical protein JEY97_10830 [Bacteroidales bacterium]|nr:hypothetical protein [Bacteroidales bacterium]
MQNNEKIKKDLAIGLDFVETIIQNPELLDEIPNGTTISFLDKATQKTETKKEQRMKRKYVKVMRKFELL